MLAGVFWVAIPQAQITGGTVEFRQVQSVVQVRCAVCHAQTPVQPGIAAAPKGVLLETEAQIRTQAALIVQQSVTTRVMPPGNLTKMSAEERALIAQWAAGLPAK